ncbi:MAG: type II toxin-antitoxin system PemK/MazF family toxin [Verrucomicrobia bacterium]|nr:type II toxin-antitoxin system PemK/MazF family toxin [Verrucomicrobiota bacterium]
MISEGDVVVAELPQADGMVKPRPVLILRELPGFGDLLVCGISTQIRHAESDFDVIFEEGDERFSDSGLRATSVVRLNFLASIPVNRMTRRLKKISLDAFEALQSNLSATSCG